MRRVQRPTLLGPVAGRRVEVTTVGGPRPVEVYTGIPYGRAARFRAPQAAGGWTGVLDATRPGPIAPQPRGALDLVPGSQPDGPSCEDCLSLSVWTPAPSGSDPRPVMVWVHGGSFLIGAASLPVSDGARLAAEGDVVVVAMNYRLGALGFVSLESCGGGDWGAAANLGLRDQLLALEWIRAHALAFGGDPARITVFGESAGAGSIMHLLASRRGDGAFDGAIVQSGSTGRTLEPDAAAVIARAFLHALGLEHADEQTLEQFTAAEIIAAQSKAQSDPEVWATAGMMPYHPSIDGDVVDAAPTDAIAAGAGASVPLLLGTTRDEMCLFLESASMERARLVARTARYAGITPDDAERVVAAYEAFLARSGRRAEPIDVWGAVFSDREMLLPARRVLDAHAANGGTGFGYLFAWSAPERPDGRPLGAAHGVDLPFTFGNFDAEWSAFVGADADPEAAAQCSRAMRAAWCRFAATGDPSDPGMPWPQWRVPERATMVFGAAGPRAAGPGAAGPGAAATLAADPSAERVRLWEPGR